MYNRHISKCLLSNFQPVTVLHLDHPQCPVAQVLNALVRLDIQAKLVQVAPLGITNQHPIAMVRFVFDL